MSDDKLIKANNIAKTIGEFSIYKGINEKKIHDKEGPAFLAKQLLAHCQPEDDWETANLTKLKKPLIEQKNKEIIVTTKGNPQAIAVFGEGKVHISRQVLAKLSSSAEIVTQQSLIPQQLFLKIQNELIDQIGEQEQRTLGEILHENNLTTRWRKNWKALGFNSIKAFDKTANTSMLILASGICLAGDIHFLVEQHKSNGLAYNKIRKGNLNKATPTLLLSIPGLNLRYGVDIEKSLQKELIIQMWDCVLAAAKRKGVKFLSIPAIGLGAFAGKNPSQTASFYFDSLMKLLATKYKNDFSSIYYCTRSSKKPEGFNTEFQTALNQYADKIGKTQIQNYKNDVKFLAVELAKQNIRCALINPSDADVVWGVRDVGEYYKQVKNSYAVEEDIAATSTAPFLSREISGVYTNNKKVVSTTVNTKMYKTNSNPKSIESSQSTTLTLGLGIILVGFIMLPLMGTSFFAGRLLACFLAIPCLGLYIKNLFENQDQRPSPARQIKNEMHDLSQQKGYLTGFNHLVKNGVPDKMNSIETADIIKRKRAGLK